jgi:hypothetical protein
MNTTLEKCVLHKYVTRTIASTIMGQTNKTTYELGIDEQEIIERVWEQIQELLEMKGQQQ